MKQQQLMAGSSIGLEITPNGLYAVEVKIHPRETVVERVACGETPEGSVVDGQVIDAAALSRALRRLWDQGRFATRRCVVTVAARSLTQQMVTVPPAPPEEQRLIIRGELERFGPVPDDCYFEWLPMAAGGGPGGNSLVFLADRAVIAGYEEALAGAGLVATAYEPEAIAALRGLQLSLTSYHAAAAVYVADNCSEMAFLETDGVRYYRRLDAGLEDATDPLESGHAWSASAPDPENSVEGPYMGSYGLVALSETVDVEELRPLAREISRSIQYYARAYGDSPQPQRLFLLGDHGPLDRLAEMVSAELSLECDYLHPARLFAHNPRLGDVFASEGSDRFLVALGGALRPVGIYQTGFALNLKAASEAQKLANQASRILVQSLSGSAALLVIALAVSAFLSLRLNRAESELKRATEALQVATVEREVRVARVKQVQKAADRLRKEALPISQLLTCLATVIPDRLAIAELNLKEDGSLSLAGEAVAPQDVNTLIQQLSDGPQFRTPSLEALDAGAPGSSVHFTAQTGLVGYGKRPESGR
jgi:type IV pilus assembly protein PilM